MTLFPRLLDFPEAAACGLRLQQPRETQPRYTCYAGLEHRATPIDAKSLPSTPVKITKSMPRMLRHRTSSKTPRWQ
ncbi:MAG UNVERIFIED_CONTAM: hypothetical protein LVR18_13175 [Planctomycetaceae bacterium]